MKRFFNILKNTFVVLIVCLAVMMVFLTILSAKSTQFENRSILGYKAYIVLTDSMSATDFKAGDLVIVKEVVPEKLEVGDIISYRLQSLEHTDEVVTHKIRDISHNSDGSLSFSTYGTTTGIDDKELVLESNILGRYKFSIPKLGSLVQYLRTTPGYIMCILLPFLLIILIQAVNSLRLFGKYKSEALEEVNEEKEKLAKERKATRLMRRKLAVAEVNNLKMREEIEELKKIVSETSPAAAKKKAKKSASKKSNIAVTKELEDLKMTVNKDALENKAKESEEKKPTTRKRKTTTKKATTTKAKKPATKKVAKKVDSKAKKSSAKTTKKTTVTKTKTERKKK